MIGYGFVAWIGSVVVLYTIAYYGTILFGLKHAPPPVVIRSFIYGCAAVGLYLGWSTITGAAGAASMRGLSRPARRRRLAVLG